MCIFCSKDHIPWVFRGIWCNKFSCRVNIIQYHNTKTTNPLMKQQFFWIPFWGIISCLVLSLGCSRTVLEISNAPILSHSNNSLSPQQVGSRISQAGVKVGWVMDSTQPGEIIGTYKSSRHSVTVSIPYSSRNYSILYRQSTGIEIR